MDPDVALWSSVLLCFGSGALTALHPCPFTTNIAAISLITAWAGHWRKCLRIAGGFICGFAMAYLLLGLVIAAIGQGITAWAGDISHVFGFIIGPTLIVAGMLQVELLSLPDGGKRGQILKQRLKQKQWGVLGAAGLGFLLALAFCPATAGLFFGVLLPHILETGSVVLLPVAFGVGAAVPLAVCALVLVANPLALRNPGAWQQFFKYGAGVLLIGVGCYRCVVDLIL